MKRLCLFLALMTLFMIASAVEELRPLPRVTVFHYDTADNDMLYNALAAIPMNVFHYNGKVYQSPVVADNLDAETTGYLLEDWKAYLSSQGGVQWLEVVGPVPSDVEAQLRTMLGLTPSQVSHLNGEPIGLAAEISNHDWVQSEYVVLAPYSQTATEDDMESAASAAAIAADLNAPLLYIYANALPLATQTAITGLSASKAIIVDYGNVVQPNVISSLQMIGVTLTDNINSTEEIIAYMKGRAGKVILAQASGLWQLVPAAYGGAVYKGAVFFYEASVAKELANNLSDWIAAYPWPTEKTNNFKMPEEVKSGSTGIWDAWANWMISVGADDPAQKEYVLTFAANGAPSYDLDRSIVGDPRVPTDAGCIAGRFPMPNADMNLDVINRTTMYRALTFANPRRNRVNFAGVCYVAGNNGPGQQYFTNTEGENHLVNEFYGGGYWGDGSEPGVFKALQDDGGDMSLHNGYDPGSGTDPMFGYSLNGFIQEIDNGANYFYYTGHGNGNLIACFTTDQGVRQDCAYGSTYWPLQAGIITSGGNGFGTGQVLSSFQNVHGISNFYNACLLSAPGSTFNEAWLQKGASSSIGSIVSVGWQDSGYFAGHFFSELATADKNFGDAFGIATALSCSIYPISQIYMQDLQYVLVGDPFMMYNQPNWTIPAPSSLGTNYGGHIPTNTVGVNLTDLHSVSLPDRINIVWTVADETDCMGYNVYRRTVGEKRWNKLNTSTINSGAGEYRYSDRTAAAKLIYEYLVGDLAGDGTETMHGPLQAKLGEARMAFSLSTAAPNPVTSITTIRYSLATSAPTRLKIYDLSGRVIKVLVDNPGATSGEYQAVWDGTDSVGRSVAAGVYVYTLSAGSQNATKRMVVAR